MVNNMNTVFIIDHQDDKQSKDSFNLLKTISDENQTKSEVYGKGNDDRQ